MALKYFKITLISLALSQALFAQKSDSPKKPGLVGFSANGTDFSASVPKVGKLDPGFSVFYWTGLTKQLDFSLRYNGLFTDYSKNAIVNRQEYTSELEGSFHARPYSDNHLISPFLTAGIGAGIYGRKTAFYAPLGGGIQVNMQSTNYIFLQANYRLAFDDKKLDNNMFYSLGFAQSISSPKVKATPPPPPPAPVVVAPKDTDKDGIVDSLDKCPTVAGIAKYQGCPIPDTDKDGINDEQDKCPTVAGIAKYNGCPIPDTDGDGFNDEVDKCASVAGIAKYQGCPMPDADKDGVADEDDKCPNLAGPASNNGCPEIKAEIKKQVEAAAKNIYFATGSAKLLAKSNAGLNSIANVLKADNDLKLNIAGHTDNTGKIDKNQTLSEARAKAVYDYLVKKGVPAERLQSAGYGQTQPIADNKTAAGRAKNRRVVTELHYD